MREWFENEEFWRVLYPYMFGDAGFAAAKDQVRQIIKLTGIRRGAVLDLCCGPGRHSIALAGRDFQVTAVDRTKFLLNKAQQRANSARAKIEFIHADMRDFVRPNTYRLILNMFTSFGYFDKKDEDRRVLHNMFVNLKSGGVCVIDVMGKERIAKIMQPVTVSRYPDGALMIQLHEIFDDWTRIRNEWILLRGNRARRFRFHHTLYSGQELIDRLSQAGFAEVKLYGEIDGRPYTPDAPRLVAVARKR